MSGEPADFEGFLAWLSGRAESGSEPPADLPAGVHEAAREAWSEFQSLRREQSEELRHRLNRGEYYEEISLLAAADADRSRWLPRLRTPNGFAISALYAPGSAP